MFLSLGVGVLLPWNAYISAKHYFESRLCSEENGKPIIESIEGCFSVIYNGACVVSLAVVILIQHFADAAESAIPGATSGVHTLHGGHTTTRLDVKASTAMSIIFKSTNLYSPMSTRSLRIDKERGSANYTWFMVMLPLAAYLAVFFITTLLVFVPGIPPHVFAVLTLVGLFVCGVCTAAASSGIVGTAGLFDPSIGVNPYFNGQAVGGLFVAMANFLATVLNSSVGFLIEFCGVGMGNSNEAFDTASGSQEGSTCLPYTEVSWATAGYFSMSCVILGVCMVGYSYIDEYKHLARRTGLVGGSSTLYSSVSLNESFDVQNDNMDDNDNGEEDDIFGESDLGDRQFRHFNIDEKPPGGTFQESREENNNDDIGNSKQTISKWQKCASVAFSSYQNESKSGDFDPDNYDRQSSADSDTSENTQSLTYSVWLSVRGSALCLFLVYFCTLAIFPVWTSELISIQQCRSSSRILNDLFTPLSFVIFNVGDLVGRTMSSAVDLAKIHNLSSKLALSSALRMAFFAAFLVCQAKHNRFSDWVILNDWFSWTLQFLFAWTNGFLTNVTFCYAPSLVENKTHPQQVASAILNFALSFGLLCGSFFAYPYLSFAQQNGHS